MHAGIYTLNIGCHRGTITSRDSETRDFATYAEAHIDYLRAKQAWARFGYVVWFAEIIGPDGVLTHLESNSNYR